MISIGFDPGREGSMAIYENGKILWCEPFPFIGDELDVSKLARTILEHTGGKNRRAFLEKVGAMPGQGVCSMFTFGKLVGEIRGMLKTLGIPFAEPTPVSWKKVVLVGTDWKGKKSASCEHVTRRYPEVDLTPGKKKKPHDGMADAICLAEFGGR